MAAPTPYPAAVAAARAAATRGLWIHDRMFDMLQGAVAWVYIKVALALDPTLDHHDSGC